MVFYVIVSSSSQIGLVQAVGPSAAITVTRAKALSHGAIGNAARVMPGSHQQRLTRVNSRSRYQLPKDFTIASILINSLALYR